MLRDPFGPSTPTDSHREPEVGLGGFGGGGGGGEGNGPKGSVNGTEVMGPVCHTMSQK